MNLTMVNRHVIQVKRPKEEQYSQVADITNLPEDDRTAVLEEIATKYPDSEVLHITILSIHKYSPKQSNKIEKGQKIAVKLQGSALLIQARFIMYTPSDPDYCIVSISEDYDKPNLMKGDLHRVRVADVSI